jgi:hypothetical protein
MIPQFPVPPKILFNLDESAPSINISEERYPMERFRQPTPKPDPTMKDVLAKDPEMMRLHNELHSIARDHCHLSTPHWPNIEDQLAAIPECVTLFEQMQARAAVVLAG